MHALGHIKEGNKRFNRNCIPQGLGQMGADLQQGTIYGEALNKCLLAVQKTGGGSIKAILTMSKYEQILLRDRFPNYHRQKQMSSLSFYYYYCCCNNNKSLPPLQGEDLSRKESASSRPTPSALLLLLLLVAKNIYTIKFVMLFPTN